MSINKTAADNITSAEDALHNLANTHWDAESNTAHLLVGVAQAEALLAIARVLCYMLDAHKYE